MRVAFLLLVSAGLAVAQSAGQNPQLTASKAFYGQIKDTILKSLDKVPDDKMDYRPTPEVRTMAQLFGHLADAQFLLCNVAKEGKTQFKGLEKSAKTKAELRKALTDGFSFCDAVYESLTDSSSAELVDWFGQKRTKLSMLDFNIAHSFEHYGNLVTYMRMNSIVPPSSERRQ